LVFNSSASLPNPPTFVNDIAPPTGNLSDCTGCHSSNSPFEGIPIYFDVEGYAGSEKSLYRNVMDRVNQADPENSLLLRKPTEEVPHGGGAAITTDSDVYYTLQNWIRAGAPCGNLNEENTAKYCPTDATCLDSSNNLVACGP
jgi:hypothetical protein